MAIDAWGEVGTSQMRNSSVPNVGCGRRSHQIFLPLSMQCSSDEQVDVVLVFGPRVQVIGNPGARKTTKDGRAERLQPGVAPRSRTGSSSTAPAGAAGSYRASFISAIIVDRSGTATWTCRPKISNERASICSSSTMFS